MVCAVLCFLCVLKKELQQSKTRVDKRIYIVSIDEHFGRFSIFGAEGERQSKEVAACESVIQNHIQMWIDDDVMYRIEASSAHTASSDTNNIGNRKVTPQQKTIHERQRRTT